MQFTASGTMTPALTTRVNVGASGASAASQAPHGTSAPTPEPQPFAAMPDPKIPAPAGTDPLPSSAKNLGPGAPTPPAPVALPKAPIAPKPVAAPALPGATQSEQAVLPPFTETILDELVTASAEPRAAPATHSTTMIAHKPAELASQVARQMAEAIQVRTDRQVELTLNPEELGRVRMTLSTGEGVIAMAISADRGETLDLMRRHIEQLTEMFSEMGFENMSFTFAHGADAQGGDAKDQGDGQTGQHARGGDDPDPASVPPAPTAPLNTTAPAGLDVRV